MLLVQHHVVAVYVNLLLLSYTNFWNNYSPPNNQLCNHVLGLLQFFEYYHMFLFFFLLVDQKRFVHQSWHFLFLQMEDNIVSNLFVVLYIQMINQKVYLLLENLNQLNNINIDLVFLLIFFDWYLLQLIVLFKWDFNYSSSFASSWVNKVTTET